MIIDQYQEYKVRISIRINTVWEVKKEVWAINGEIMTVQALWPIERGIYKGEWALKLPDGYPIGWIASGDVEFL